MRVHVTDDIGVIAKAGLGENVGAIMDVVPRIALHVREPRWHVADREEPVAHGVQRRERIAAMKQAGAAVDLPASRNQFIERPHRRLVQANGEA